MPEIQDGLQLAQAISDQNKQPTAEQTEANNQEALRKIAIDAIMGRLNKPRVAPSEKVETSAMTCDAILGKCTIVDEAKPNDNSAKKPAPAKVETIFGRPIITTKPDAPPAKPEAKSGEPVKPPTTQPAPPAKSKGGG